MPNRRSFIKSVASALLLPVAPAIVRAESLMKIAPQDNWAYLMACMASGTTIAAGSYLIQRPLELRWSNWTFTLPSNVRITAASGSPYVFLGTRPLENVNLNFDGGGSLGGRSVYVAGRDILSEELRRTGASVGRVDFNGDVVNGDWKSKARK